MHLTFDQKTVKPGRKIVSDESGNKNDADLVNGAEISNRTMGIVYLSFMVILNYSNKALVLFFWVPFLKKEQIRQCNECSVLTSQFSQRVIHP